METTPEIQIMARVNHQIAHLIHIDAKAASKKILEALRAEKMHMGNTAARIGCTHGTLLLWIKKLDMVEPVEKLRLGMIEQLRRQSKREGVREPRFGGRQKMSTEERAAAKAARAKTKGKASTKKAA